MPTVEVTLPEEVLSEFERLADDEFTNREEAVEQLLGAGIRTYTREPEQPDATELSDEYTGGVWDTAGESPEEENDLDGGYTY